MYIRYSFPDGNTQEESQGRDEAYRGSCRRSQRRLESITICPPPSRTSGSLHRGLSRVRNYTSSLLFLCEHIALLCTWFLVPWCACNSIEAQHISLGEGILACFHVRVSHSIFFVQSRHHGCRHYAYPVHHFFSSTCSVQECTPRVCGAHCRQLGLTGWNMIVLCVCITIPRSFQI